MIEVLAVVTSLIVGGCAMAITWIAKRALEAQAQVGVERVALAEARARVDALGVAIDDRDHALAAKQAELDRVLAAKLVVDRQLADARSLCETLAANQPALLGAAVRAQLERVRALAQPRLPDDPAAAAGAAAEGDRGPGAVLAPAAGGDRSGP